MHVQLLIKRVCAVPVALFLSLVGFAPVCAQEEVAPKAEIERIGQLDAGDFDELQKTRESIEQSLVGREPDFGNRYYRNQSFRLASVLLQLGDFQRALAILEGAEKALADAKLEMNSEKWTDLATCRNRLGCIAYEQGDYPAAKHWFELALPGLPDSSEEKRKCLTNLATTLIQLGDLARGEKVFQEILREHESRRDEQRIARTCHNLGVIFLELGELKKAESYIQRDLNFWRQQSDLVELAHSLDTLAFIYSQQGRLDDAVGLYSEALELFEKSGNVERDIARVSNNMGFALVKKGEFESGRRLLQRALTIRSSFRDKRHPERIDTVGDQALLEFSAGNNPLAVQLATDSLIDTASYLRLVWSGQSERQQLAAMTKFRRFLDQYLSIVVSTHGNADEIYGQVLGWKGEVFSRQQSARLAATNPELKETFDEIRSTTSRLARLILADNPKSADAESAARFAALSNRKEELEIEISHQVQSLNKIPKLVSARELSDVLPENIVLVDFIEFDRFLPFANQLPAHTQRWLIAFVSRAGDPVRLIDLGPTELLAQAVDNWRKSLGVAPDAQAAGALLRKRIWTPISDRIPEEATVLISPDGVVNRFPFAALPGSKPGTYLIEERAVAGFPVPQMLPSLMEDRAEPVDMEGNMLLLGGVDYDALAESKEQLKSRRTFGRRRSAARWGDEKFAELPATKGEVAGIEKRYRQNFGNEGIAVLEGSSATESAMLARASRYHYLHMATHGFFAPPALATAMSGGESRGSESAVSENYMSVYPAGLLSGIVLAGANEPQPGDDDGILTAEEVSLMDLSQVELVVLSACETGLGPVAGGEGMLGLQRAFQVAGAKSVVASLWKVPDTETRDLMERFYENLWDRELDTLSALREAQLWMLREGQSRGDGKRKIGIEELPQRTPPVFWAAFVLSGDWR